MFKTKNFEKAHHLAFVGISILIISLLLSLTACSSKQDGEKWNCTVSVPQNSNEIIFCEPVVHSNSGKLCFSNHTNIDVNIFLYELSNIDSHVWEEVLSAGRACCILQVPSDTYYRIGIKANISEKRDVTVIVSEYENSEPFTIMTE